MIYVPERINAVRSQRFSVFCQPLQWLCHFYITIHISPRVYSKCTRVKGVLAFRNCDTAVVKKVVNKGSQVLIVQVTPEPIPRRLEY